MIWFVLRAVWYSQHWLNQKRTPFYIPKLENGKSWTIYHDKHCRTSWLVMLVNRGCGDQLSPFCDSHQNLDLGCGWKAKLQCLSRFLHFSLLILDIKGGSFSVESVLWISNSSQNEPTHPYSCFLWQRCVSSFSFIVSQDWQGCFRLSEEVVRKPKLFFVSTSATTSTLQTASVCYVLSAATVVTCTGRKRRTISLDGMQPEGAVQPSTFKREVEGESVQQDEASSKVNEKREGRFLLYWITTTSISTSTSFTITYTISSALCTPAGANACP